MPPTSGHQEATWHRLKHSVYLLPLVVGLLLRIAAFPLVHFSKPQLWEYGQIARNMLAGYGYAFDWFYLGNGIVLKFPTAYMPPGQVMVDFLGLRLFGDGLAGFTALFAEEILLNLAFVYATGRILELLFKERRITRLGLWLTALYPPFIVASASFGVLSLALMLDAIFVWTAVELIERVREGRRSAGYALAAGFTAGLLTLVRSESFGVLGITLLVLGWKNRDLLARSRRSIVLMLSAAAIVAAPWVIRNYVTFHKVILGSTSGSFNFWRGHNPYATGSSWNELGQPIWTTDTMWFEMEPGLPIDSNVEFTQGTYHWNRAKQWITAHPGTEAIRTLRKAVLFWGIDWYSKDARRIPYVLSYLATFTCFLIGIWRIRRTRATRSHAARDGLTIIALWCVLYTIVTMTFFSLPRLQIILTGVYFPVVIYGADWILNRLLSHRSKTADRSHTVVVAPATVDVTETVDHI